MLNRTSSVTSKLEGEWQPPVIVNIVDLTVWGYLGDKSLDMPEGLTPSG